MEKPRLGRFGVGLTTTALALAGMAITLALPSAAAQRSTAPELGSCFSYGIGALKQISSAAPAIGCTDTHTAETYWVGSLPEKFGPPTKATQGARLATTTACNTNAMNAYVGMAGRSLPSRWLSFSVFPSDSQWAAGERWVRCDVALKTGLKLTDLTTRAADFVTASGVDYFNFCTPTQPNARNTESYPCTNPKKNWIMVTARELGGPGSKFPGNTAVQRRTSALCEQVAKRFSGGSKFPSWWAIWPTDRGWKEGRREGQCLVPYSQYQAAIAPKA